MQVWMIFVAIIVILAFGFYAGGKLVEYSVEFWASRRSGSTVDVSFWVCGVAGIFVGWNIALPVALVTWMVDKAS